jgi:hypothetical protein
MEEDERDGEDGPGGESDELKRWNSSFPSFIPGEPSLTPSQTWGKLDISSSHPSFRQGYESVFQQLGTEVLTKEDSGEASTLASTIVKQDLENQQVLAGSREGEDSWSEEYLRLERKRVAESKRYTSGKSTGSSQQKNYDEMWHRSTPGNTLELRHLEQLGQLRLQTTHETMPANVVDPMPEIYVQGETEIDQNIGKSTETIFNRSHSFS